MDQPGIILIVDDEPLGRETLEALLKPQGYHLLFATNGADALVQASIQPPDLVLLDIMMPGMDGFTVCRRLRADPLLAEVPVLLITALDDRDSRLRGIEAGADDFISKPFDRAELRMRVRTIVRLNRYRRLLDERTQRQQAEAEVVRRNQDLILLQEATQLKNQFVSNVSHELRTPLSIMMMHIGNLDMLYEQMEDAKRRSLIHTIREQTRLLHELITNVLDISYLDSGMRSIENHTLNLAALLREEAERQMPLAERKSQHFKVLGLDQVFVHANEGQMRQVLCNLLNNAIKYTPDGGTITAECRIYQPAMSVDPGWPGSTELDQGSWAAFCISDNGMGMPREVLERIFERFYRAGTQGAILGTGLGLSIVQEIVTLHQGQIAVASTLGEGSRFAVYLPLLNEEHTQ